MAELQEAKKAELEKQQPSQPEPEKELTEEEKKANTQKADDIKQEGNTLFHAAKYAEALDKYQEAFKLNKNSVQILSNIAACQNKLKLYKEAIETCKKGKLVDKTWVKLYYREGEALYNLEEYMESASAYWEGWQLALEDLQLKQLFLKSVDMAKQKEWFKKKQ